MSYLGVFTNIDSSVMINRLNVAVSRAQCLAIVIANRELVEAHATNIREMEDMNHLCRIFEDEKIAQEWPL